MTTKHTPGPWFADNAGRIWRRPPADLYENGGDVAGDKPLATVDKGWYRENEQGYPIEANARLIAAAPDLLEALQRLVMDGDVRDSAGKGAINEALAAIAKAVQP